MTRYFAVRETVLGVGGLVAALVGSPLAVRAWSALGALTDAGDFAATVDELRHGRRSVLPQAVLAAGAFFIETSAVTASRRAARGV